MPKIEEKEKNKKVLDRNVGKSKVEVKVDKKEEKGKAVQKRGVRKNITKGSKEKSAVKEKTSISKEHKTGKSKIVSKTKEKSTKLKKNETDLTDKIVATKKENKERKFLPEYYDLPYRYNETIVRILYQTPRRIFVYWDVSDKDRQRYIKVFGEDFFEKTYPVLLVHNEEMNYTFEVPINDFANSWYLDIRDPKTKYVIQLGRKFKEIQKERQNIDYKAVEEENINLQNDYIYITNSNEIETPNDRVLFDRMPEKITYRNVKTGAVSEKPVREVLSKVVNTYKEPEIEDLYKELYGDEMVQEEFDILNPSSGGLSSSGGSLTSSSFK